MRIGVLWALFVASFKMFIRNRAAVFFSLFLPLIIMLIFGVLNFEGSTEIQLGIVDEAQTEESEIFINSLGEFEYLVISEGDSRGRIGRAGGGEPRVRPRHPGRLPAAVRRRDRVGCLRCQR